MLLKDLHLGNAQETVDIRVTDGKFAQIAPNLEPIPGEETVTDCAGKMVLPPLCRVPRTPGHLPDRGPSPLEPHRNLV